MGPEGIGRLFGQVWLIINLTCDVLFPITAYPYWYKEMHNLIPGKQENFFTHSEIIKSLEFQVV